jgi:glycosyltransferase involved in cell wall biosynthesis
MEVMKISASDRKILFVLPTDTFGGAERVTFNVIKGMQSFEPVLLVRRQMNKFFSPLGINTYNFEDYNCSMPDISLRTIFLYARAVRSVSKSSQPAIIFGVMHFASLYATLARDLFFLKIPIVASIHGTYSSHFKSVNRSPSFKEKTLIRYSLQRFENVIVPSAGIKSDIISHFRVSGRKFTVIYNGFDLEWIRSSGLEEIPLIKDCPWLVTASRLGPPKDFTTLLKAFRIIRNKIKVRLLIIGDGPYEGDIKEEISSLKLDGDVYMTGFQKNPFKYISRSDIFILSSLSEGFPGVLIEAMALGVPVVSIDCPSGPAEIIKDRENGLLVPISDAGKLAKACLSILSDPVLRNRLIEGGLERAGYFSAHRMNREYNEYFASIIK